MMYNPVGVKDKLANHAQNVWAWFWMSCCIFWSWKESLVTSAFGSMWLQFAPKTVQHCEFDPVAIFLGQYHWDLPEDYIVFKACRSTKSWLRCPNTCNRFQMKVSFCDIFKKNPVVVSLKTGRFPSPGGKNHPWRWQIRKQDSKSPTSRFLFNFSCVNEAFAKR